MFSQKPNSDYEEDQENETNSSRYSEPNNFDNGERASFHSAYSQDNTAENEKQSTNLLENNDNLFPDVPTQPIADKTIFEPPTKFGDKGNSRDYPLTQNTYENTYVDRKNSQDFKKDVGSNNQRNVVSMASQVREIENNKNIPAMQGESGFKAKFGTMPDIRGVKKNSFDKQDEMTNMYQSAGQVEDYRNIPLTQSEFVSKSKVNSWQDDKQQKKNSFDKQEEAGSLYQPLGPGVMYQQRELKRIDSAPIKESNRSFEELMEGKKAVTPRQSEQMLMEARKAKEREIEDEEEREEYLRELEKKQEKEREKERERQQKLREQEVERERFRKQQEREIEEERERERRELEKQQELEKQKEKERQQKLKEQELERERFKKQQEIEREREKEKQRLKEQKEREERDERERLRQQELEIEREQELELERIREQEIEKQKEKEKVKERLQKLREQELERSRKQQELEREKQRLKEQKEKEEREERERQEEFEREQERERDRIRQLELEKQKEKEREKDREKKRQFESEKLEEEEEAEEVEEVEEVVMVEPPKKVEKMTSSTSMEESKQKNSRKSSMDGSQKGRSMELYDNFADDDTLYPMKGGRISKTIQTQTNDLEFTSGYVTGLQSERVEISIPETKMVRDGLIYTYLVYKIVTKLKDEEDRQTEFTVFRRYSDFDWLFENITNKYHGYVIPVPPPKNILTAFNKEGVEFSETRKKELVVFLRKCMQHPFLKNTPELNIFLSDDRGFSDFKKREQALSQNRSALPILMNISKMLQGAAKAKPYHLREIDGAEGDLYNYEVTFMNIKKRLQSFSTQKLEQVQLQKKQTAALLSFTHKLEDTLSRSRYSKLDKEFQKVSSSNISEIEDIAIKDVTDKVENHLKDIISNVDAVIAAIERRNDLAKNLNNMHEAIEEKSLKFKKDFTNGDELEELKKEYERLKKKCQEASEILLKELKAHKERIDVELDMFLNSLLTRKEQYFKEVYDLWSQTCQE